MLPQSKPKPVIKNTRDIIKKYIGKQAHDAMVIMEHRVPGATDMEKRAWCRRAVINAVEMYDQRLPVFGCVADNIIVDAIEKQFVDEIVDVVWNSIENEVHK